jgi:hypothetical protein
VDADVVLLLEALGRLDKRKALGVVFNDHREYRHSYRSYAYKSYGMAGGPGKGDRY